ncbi:MAG: co-chaperone GroES [Armatimonadetes bacterium]|nr:co-chaperone GroES [Armatimonadota bacterium]
MLQPLGDRVLVKPLSAEEKTAGGIILPEKAQEKPREGEVVAVGPGKLLDSGERRAMSVKVGDVVVYSEFGGTEVSHEGEDYLLIDEGSILAVKE